MPSTIHTEPGPSFLDICSRVNGLVDSFLEKDSSTLSPSLVQTQRHVGVSLDVISKALSQYGLDGLALSYNGGKDCLALVILTLSAIHRHYSHSNTTQPPPQSLSIVYVRSQNAFEEVEDFVTASCRAYRLEATTYELPMKEAFSRFLEVRPTTQAIMVGTRRTDPHGAQLSHFDPTDHGWPKFTRVHPVVDWKYVDIWNVCLAVVYLIRKGRCFTSNTAAVSSSDISISLTAPSTTRDTPPWAGS